MGTKFLQQYGGLLLFLCAAFGLRVSFTTQDQLRDNLPRLAIAVGIFAVFEVILFIWLRLHGRPMELLDALNELLGVLAVSLAFLTQGILRLIGGVVWLVYQLLEGRLEERLSRQVAGAGEPGRPAQRS